MPRASPGLTGRHAACLSRRPVCLAPALPSQVPHLSIHIFLLPYSIGWVRLCLMEAPSVGKQVTTLSSCVQYPRAGARRAAALGVSGVWCVNDGAPRAALVRDLSAMRLPERQQAVTAMTQPARHQTASAPHRQSPLQQPADESCLARPSFHPWSGTWHEGSWSAKACGWACASAFASRLQLAFAACGWAFASRQL